MLPVSTRNKRNGTEQNPNQHISNHAMPMSTTPQKLLHTKRKPLSTSAIICAVDVGFSLAKSFGKKANLKLRTIEFAYILNCIVV